MNRICNLILISLVISDSAFCMPMWYYPDSHQYYNKEYENVIVPKFHRSPNPEPSYPLEIYMYDDDTPVNSQVQFSHLLQYYPPAELRSFFILSIPVVPVPQPHPVQYVVPNKTFYSRQSSTNTPSTSTGARSIKTKVTSTSVSLYSPKSSTNTPSTSTTARSIKTKVTSTSVSLYSPKSSTNTPSTSTTAQSIETKVTNTSVSQNNQTSTKIVKRGNNNKKERKEEISEAHTESSIIRKSTRSMVVDKPLLSDFFCKQRMENFEKFINRFRNQTTSNDIIQKFINRFCNQTTSNDIIQLTSSTRPETSEMVQSTLSIHDTNPVSSSISPPTNDPVDSRQLSIDANDTKVTLLEKSTTYAMTSQNTESYLSTVSSGVENVTDNGTKIYMGDVGHSTAVQSLISTNTPLIEISLKNVTEEVLQNNMKVVDATTTVISSFEASSPILEPLTKNVTDDSKSLAFDTTTKIPVKLIADDVTTMVSPIDTNTPDFVIISDKDQEQSTTNTITTSTSPNPNLSSEVETETPKKFISNSNESETMKKYDQFTTFATPAPRATPTDKFYRKIFETTSMPDATTIQLDSASDSKHDTIIDLEEFAINVPLPSNSIKANLSDNEISNGDFVTFKSDNEPNEAGMEYEVTTGTMPSGSSESSTNINEIKRRYVASDSNSKLDIDNNDSQEYIFNATASKFHVFQSSVPVSAADGICLQGSQTYVIFACVLILALIFDFAFCLFGT